VAFWGLAGCTPHTIDDDEHVFYTGIDEETLRNLPEYKRD
jgi:hypothetical protein